MTHARTIVALLWTIGFTTSSETLAGERNGGAPLLAGLGDHHHAISTKSPEAQKYFDQGLVLLYAFNHNEAVRAFEEAARLDPECAMAYWGISFALGPNINAPATEEGNKRAFGAIEKAQLLAEKASPKEKAYMGALAKRYTKELPKDRAPLDAAYADAMRDVARRFPEDLDAATLFAEASMDTMPWNYWTPEGQPRQGTQEIIDTLEHVLKLNPDHPGANHYYIHAVEASPNPERGLASAQRLETLVPASGHLVHMPSHIYLRLGMYHRASEMNELAIVADEDYIAACKAQGFYPANYYSHNVHFLWYSSSMEGRRATALAAARKTAEIVTEKSAEEMPHLAWLRSVPQFAFVRFGMWDEVLSAPEPNNLFEKALWHGTRGLAFARQRKLTEAKRESTSLDKIARSKEVEMLEMPNFPGLSILRIADTILKAEVAGLEGNKDQWTMTLDTAVHLEDQLAYMEPPYWYIPTRHFLGAALLECQKEEAAESVYRDDLIKHPNNGWALFGLMQSLRAQGKAADAERVHAQFLEAWKHADIALTSSRP
ncbi:MAG: hypothetical protein U1D30_16255 [Planctomycetota bacterium]